MGKVKRRRGLDSVDLYWTRPEEGREMEFALSFYSHLDLSLKDIIATIRHGEEVGIQYAVVG